MTPGTSIYLLPLCCNVIHKVLWGHSMDWIPPSSFTWSFTSRDQKSSKTKGKFCWQGRHRAVKKWTGVEQEAFRGSQSWAAHQTSSSCILLWGLLVLPHLPPIPTFQSHPGDFPWRQDGITVIIQGIPNQLPTGIAWYMLRNKYLIPFTNSISNHKTP